MIYQIIPKNFEVSNHCTTPQSGKDANTDERAAALTAANQFIKDKNYSSDTKVMLACGENMLEKHYSSYLDFPLMHMLIPQSVFDVDRSRSCQKGVRPPCLSSSSSTGWTRMKLQARVSPTELVKLPRWSRSPSMPLNSMTATPWLPSTAWWMMDPGKSRFGH